MVGLAVGFIFYLDAALEDEDEVVVGLALLVEQRVGIGTGLIFVAHADHAHHQAVLHQPAQHRLRHPLAAERLVRFRFHNKKKQMKIKERNEDSFVDRNRLTRKRTT